MTILAATSALLRGLEQWIAARLPDGSVGPLAILGVVGMCATLIAIVGTIRWIHADARADAAWARYDAAVRDSDRQRFLAEHRAGCER